MGRPTPLLRIHELVALSFISSAAVFSQVASNDVEKLVVVIHVAHPEQQGTGLIVGEIKKSPSEISLAVLTAAHVVSSTGTPSIKASFSDRRKVQDLKCVVIKTAQNEDLALLECGPLNYRPHLSFDVLADQHDLKKGASLMLYGGPNKLVVAGGIYGKSLPTQTPANTKDCDDDLMFFFPVGTQLNGNNGSGQNSPDLAGFSGGPVMTDRSGIVGIDVEQNQPTATATARSWCAVENFLTRQTDRLKVRAPSAPALRPGNVEVAAEVCSLYVPQFGWLTTAPKIRVSTTFPRISSLDLVFDFTFSQASQTFSGATESLSVVLPAVTADYAIGAALPKLRTNRWVGGLYVGAGGAPVFLQDTLRSYTTQSASVHSWGTVFDAGYRFRIPGKQWGISASYREAVLTGTSAQALYPRLRTASVGVFGLFH